MARARAKTGKSAGRKTASKRRPSRRGRQRGLELKPVFNRVSSSLEQLKGSEQTREVKGAIVRLNRCLREIRDICAPDMIIPLQPKL